MTKTHLLVKTTTQWNISGGSKIVEFCDCSVFAVSPLYVCRLWISIMASLKRYLIFCFRSWSYCRCPVSICLWLVHCYLNQMQRSCTNGKHWNEISHFKGQVEYMLSGFNIASTLGVSLWLEYVWLLSGRWGQALKKLTLIWMNMCTCRLTLKGCFHFPL